MMQEKQSGTGFAVKNCCFPVVWLRYFFIAKEKTNQAAVKIAFLASKKSNTGAQGVFFCQKKDAPARGVRGAPRVIHLRRRRDHYDADRQHRKQKE